MKMDYMEEEITYTELHTEYVKLYKNNKGLIDSMHYAAFVQQGILPQERHFKGCFLTILFCTSLKALLVEIYIGLDKKAISKFLPLEIAPDME